MTANFSAVNETITIDNGEVAFLIGTISIPYLNVKMNYGGGI